MSIKIYTKEFSGMIENIFEGQSAFLSSFGGELQVIQGAEAYSDFLHLKVSDTEVVIQEYSTDADVAFGTGTGSSNRFGPRKEVKSIDLQVPFDEPLSIHDGVDRYTVNDIPEEIVAERLGLHASAWAQRYDEVMGAAIAASASETITGELNEAGVVGAFAKANKSFVNNRVSRGVEWIAYVTSDVYNILIDSNLARLDKGSTINIDNQELYKFKGFVIKQLPDDQLLKDVYFVADNVGVAGVAIPIARVMDSEDLAGSVIQGAGKLGKYIPEKNNKAIVLADLTPQG